MPAPHDATESSDERPNAACLSAIPEPVWRPLADRCCPRGRSVGSAGVVGESVVVERLEPGDACEDDDRLVRPFDAP